MNYPTYVIVNNHRYNIKTDFRIALKCNEIAEDNSIGDIERALAIIYTLYGKEALKYEEDYEELLEKAIKYLRCGEESNVISDNERDVDLKKDEKYIISSFKYDYSYNPYELEYLHWYAFWNDLNNLSYSEIGNCCVLSRIRTIRNADLSTITDDKLRNEVAVQKELYSLNKNEPTEEEKQNAREFIEKLKGRGA